MKAEAGSTKRASPQAQRKPSSVVTAEEAMARTMELPRPDISRRSASTASYQRSEGPLKGGMGNWLPWKEKRISTATGRKMKT